MKNRFSYNDFDIEIKFFQMEKNLSIKFPIIFITDLDLKYFYGRYNFYKVMEKDSFFYLAYDDNSIYPPVQNNSMALLKLKTVFQNIKEIIYIPTEKKDIVNNNSVVLLTYENWEILKKW